MEAALTESAKQVPALVVLAIIVIAHLRQRHKDVIFLQKIYDRYDELVSTTSRTLGKALEVIERAERRERKD
jgi:hypothetical protein